jgi:spore germination protein
MNRTKQMFLIFALLSLIMTTGCWDRTEIEDMGIVLGIGIDKPKTITAKKRAEKEAKENKEEKEKIAKHPRVSVVHNYIVPKAVAGKQGGGNQKPYENLITEGESIFEVIRELSTHTARPPSYQHLKIIVISEEIARTIDLRNIIDFFLRNPETRRTIKVLIAKGKTREVFEVPPRVATNPALKLFEMTGNTKKTLRMAPELNLGDMSEKLTGETSFVMQRVVPSERETKIAGAAVIKGKTRKMIGWLGEEEIEGLNWLSGKGKAGIIKGMDKKTEKMIIYEVYKMKSKIQPKVQGKDISFTVTIETEGELREDWLIPGDAFKESMIKKAEKATETQIKTLAQKALQKTQKDFKVDVAGFGKQLSIHYPKVWKEVKKDWDRHFSTIPVEIKVSVHIREFGTRGSKE